MTIDTDREESTVDVPADAFSIVGNETRLRILQTLGEAGEPLRFSELFDRIDYADASNFNYHVKQLKGYFIEEADDGYVLRPEGKRVVKAILAGFMSEKPVVERTEVETPCFLCGGDEMEVSFRNGVIGVFCPPCGGKRDGSSPNVGRADEAATDSIGHVGLPSAGVRNRTPTDILRVGELWSCWMAHASARDVCPECSAPVDHSIQVCENHETGDERCEACGQGSGIKVTTTCTHCIRDQNYDYSVLLLADLDVMAFMLDHGIDPLVPRAFHHSSLEEELISTDPFEARFTFSADGDTLSLTVNDDLSVVDVTKGRATDAE